MTYLSFLLIFVILPGFVLAVTGYFFRKENQSRQLLQRHWLGAAILAVIAVVWTTPWDNAIVTRGVWSYDVDRIIGTIGVVPIEEYIFMIMMTFANAAWILWIMPKEGVQASQWKTSQAKSRGLIISFATFGFIAGFVLLQFEPFTYLGAILVWFIPPLAVQGCFDPKLLKQYRARVCAATIVPALYFSIVDAYAIRDGIWMIHSQTQSGLKLFGLPAEEAVFFLTTSWLIAQGLFLWHSLFQTPGGQKQA
jgi:lycopene cyclase domain-containing protein